jgi:hypothetical protein
VRGPGSGGKGSLIALEGSGGRSMAVACRQMERTLRQGNPPTAGVSSWDASAIFFQIREGARGIPGPPARALILLYAADLAFRLRWQIRPALEEGLHVVAAPYLETAVAFGHSAGLSRQWLKAVFAFAPQPDACYRVPESTIPVNRRGTPADSFLEFCFAQLRNSPGIWEIEEIRQNFERYLDRLEARGKCRLVTRPFVDFAARAG